MPPPVHAQPQALPAYWTTTDRTTVKLYHGHVLNLLPRLPAKSVQMVVTSPPYWNLRDYEGEELQLGSEPSPDCGTWGQAQCGACFVCNLVGVCRGVYRVLRDDGTFWLNLGDTYGSGPGRRDNDRSRTGLLNTGNNYGIKNTKGMNEGFVGSDASTSLAAGNLVGVPWRVALALQRDGWVLRQDIVWHKPSPMPESVRNRCTKAHEYLFLLTKSQRYFYDAEAIKESSEGRPDTGVEARRQWEGGTNGRRMGGGSDGLGEGTVTRNKRSVWTVASAGYPGAHFATYPPKLIEPCILAGTSDKGACVRCGAPWVRQVEEVKLTRERPNDYVKRVPTSKLTGGAYSPPGQSPHSNARGQKEIGNTCANTVAGVESRTVGWQPSCTCPAGTGVRPCIVLDPFIGSGTTAEVCLGLKSVRQCWGIDLSAKYLDQNAVPRIKEALRARGSLHHLFEDTVIKPVVQRVSLGTAIKPVNL